jgi:hypothetical protein
VSCASCLKYPTDYDDCTVPLLQKGIALCVFQKAPFSRIKQDKNVPQNAIKICLNFVGPIAGVVSAALISRLLQPHPQRVAQRHAHHATGECLHCTK